jgi:ankyrin repeat protein
MDVMLTIQADDARAVALTVAIQGGDVEALRRQFRDHPELAAARIVDGHGVSRTLLHVAADWPGHFPNSAQIVAVLVAAGADVNARVHPGPRGSAETALHWAASSDDVEVLDALLDGGADIEASGAIFTGGAPMSDAVIFAQWRAARRLLERGAKTTISQAAALGLLDRVRDFVSAEPPPELRDITNALWHGCRGGQQAVAEFLLERGADVNWIGHDAKTPLDVAQESGQDALIQWLRARGARRAAELK